MTPYEFGVKVACEQAGIDVEKTANLAGKAVGLLQRGMNHVGSGFSGAGRVLNSGYQGAMRGGVGAGLNSMGKAFGRMSGAQQLATAGVGAAGLGLGAGAAGFGAGRASAPTPMEQFKSQAGSLLGRAQGFLGM